MKDIISTEQLTEVEAILGSAIQAAAGGETVLHDALNGLSAAIYTTDAQGLVTFFNRACIALAGRTPLSGEDRWCITWKLYTEQGAFIPHEQCPMAMAIKEGRPIRGIVAVAERPDGSRTTILPFPTPLFDEAGDIAGAVNVLIDITDHREAEQLRAQASRCKRLARSVTDRRTEDTLKLMAAEYEERAKALQWLN